MRHLLIKPRKIKFILDVVFIHLPGHRIQEVNTYKDPHFGEAPCSDVSSLTNFNYSGFPFSTLQKYLNLSSKLTHTLSHKTFSLSLLTIGSYNTSLSKSPSLLLHLVSRNQFYPLLRDSWLSEDNGLNSLVSAGSRIPYVNTQLRTLVNTLTAFQFS